MPAGREVIPVAVHDLCVMKAVCCQVALSDVQW